jgi:hypothetical protein
MDIISEIDIEFDTILHYKGYCLSYDEFLNAGILEGKYFQEKINPPEYLIPQSYRALENNPKLDNRIKIFMCENKITVCETVFPCKSFFADDYDGFTYVVNYSFDNYKTFGFIAMDTKTGIRKSSDSTVIVENVVTQTKK